MLNKHLSLLSIVILIATGFAQPNQYLGLWKTIDDNTGEEKSVVELYMKGDKLYGRISKLLPGAKSNICLGCPGDKKDKPLEGMDIIWNMTPYQTGYSYGQIMDPKNGKIYSCTLNRDFSVDFLLLVKIPSNSRLYTLFDSSA